MFIRVTMKEMSGTAMAKCFGKMEVTIRETGLMEFSMDKAAFMYLLKDLKKVSSTTT